MIAEVTDVEIKVSKNLGNAYIMLRTKVDYDNTMFLPLNPRINLFLLLCNHCQVSYIDDSIVASDFIGKLIPVKEKDFMGYKVIEIDYNGIKRCIPLLDEQPDTFNEGFW